MTLTRLMTAAVAFSLTAGVAMAQSPAPAAPVPAAPAPAAATPRLAANGDIMQTMRTSGQFTTFVKALDATNLAGLLKSTPNLTVFAPSDAAFAALPPGDLDKLLANKPALQKLLTYHLINARMDAAKIKGARGQIPTVAGDKVELDGSGEALMANDSVIVQADVMATNGVIHVVSKVLNPAAAAAAASAAPASATVSAPAAQ